MSDTYKTIDKRGDTVTWHEVTMQQWDACLEGEREIIMLEGLGVVFVKRGEA